jgi:hypothetical protein
LQQVRLARTYGVDLFVYGFFWFRGKRVFEGALDPGFLGLGSVDFPFAVMWANRMPRRVLPVKHARDPEIHPDRLVYTDPDDFLALIRFLAERYFLRPNWGNATAGAATSRLPPSTSRAIAARLQGSPPSGRAG